MKPFLLLATRAEDDAADEEYASFLRFGGLGEEQLHRVRLESGPMPPVDLADYSGVIVGGGPFNSSDPEESKSAVQLRVEAEMAALLDEVAGRDFPFFGACYGVGTLGRHQGAVVDRTYGEPVGPVEIALTPAGRADPLLEGIPETFAAYVGHKEAVAQLPPNAVNLAGSATCPVQMFRVRTNLYATQFHPELDVAGLLTRISVYRNAGYFPPEEAETVMDAVRGSAVHVPPRILANFTARYAR
ncbi:glutamine amidotransferase [Arthrobacter sp. zg-Y40]|uniref:glutamine amidotransferase n=1 Tax=unclassified Arthrobacter TaxID=235627 RepID=UPI001D143FC5|nr:MULTISPECIES: glutamine amidotransferase [unclassified Arthrobacter]MCC3275091.1 glutamine amidotransferase [Arthrobacter sp. zg-Y20]MCC3278935.1 glutamine amidotransferase [Arthrobacter sp. zg-Y40]MDK1315248.1 glutamine amidotransferase [Arthrobacter sp. zg.Y20]WIB05082.1 glutamine amidotransferase [Arthrobacter sp. zg-Y20]